MSSREGGGGLSEADVKVAVARQQVKPPIPPPTTYDCLQICRQICVMLQAAFDEERSQMKGQVLDLRSELDKAR